MSDQDQDLVRPPTAPNTVAKKKTAYEATEAEVSLAAFEKVLGGRNKLIAALITSPDLTPTIQKVLELVYDPRFGRYPLGRLCASAGILPGEFFAAVRDALQATSNMLVLDHVSTALPNLTLEMLKQAVDHDEICDLCSGTTTITVPAPRRKGQAPGEPTIESCPTCHGKGVIKVRANLEVQKLALELAGLLKKGGGLSITQQQAIVQPTKPAGNGSEAYSSDSLVKLQQATHGILFSRDLPRPTTVPVVESLDAEIVPPDTEP